MRAGWSLAATRAVLAAGLLLGAPFALAQGGGGAVSHEGDPGGDTNTKANRGSPLPGGGTTKDLTVPGTGGVADTGLGGSTNGSGNGASAGKPSGNTGAAGAPGTGTSVAGPAGQGIDGQGIDGQGIDGQGIDGQGVAGTSGGGTGAAGK